MLEEDDNFVSADLYITPPSQGEVTDEDSGPEDDGGTVDNLARAQLRSTAEAVIQDCDDTRRVGGQDVDESADADDSGQLGSDCDRFAIGFYSYSVWFLYNVNVTVLFSSVFESLLAVVSQSRMKSCKCGRQVRQTKLVNF